MPRLLTISVTIPELATLQAAITKVAMAGVGKSEEDVVAAARQVLDAHLAKHPLIIEPLLLKEKQVLDTGAPKMDFSTVGSALLDLLKEQATEAGKELKDGGKALAAYVEERATVLAAAVGKAGYSDALTAERDNIALKAAGWAIDEGDAFDARFVGIIQGALHIAVTAL